jgi:hypothetical protein
LIKEPDQAKGFTQDTQRGVVVTILRNLIRGTPGILAEKDPIRQFHLFPFPSTTMDESQGLSDAGIGNESEYQQR